MDTGQFLEGVVCPLGSTGAVSLHDGGTERAAVVVG